MNLLESSWKGWLSKSFIVRVRPFKIRYNDCECGDTTSGGEMLRLLSSAACLQRTKSCHFVRKHILSRCVWAVQTRGLSQQDLCMQSIETWKQLNHCIRMLHYFLSDTADNNLSTQSHLATSSWHQPPLSDCPPPGVRFQLMLSNFPNKCVLDYPSCRKISK